MAKLAWSQLPLSLKSRFLDGLERIATLRDQIGAAAAVSSMPPIQVIPELWYDDDRCFDGCAGPLIVNGNTVFGCTLPAQTATLEDEGTLRRVMVHEFCHCFWWLTDEVNAMDSGGTTIDTSGLDQNSDSDDRYQMVDSEDWFGVEDASRMIYSGSPETQRIPGPAAQPNDLQSLKAEVDRDRPAVSSGVPASVNYLRRDNGK